MKKTKRGNYIKNTSKIIIKKIRTNINKCISSIIVSLISTLITKLVFSKNIPTNYTRIKSIKSNDVYFLLLSAMILFTYYYLHKH
ncbi:transposase [Clostridium niameyense]|uniref:Transposase n=1 Tax=Clostridium niameyense TaxID=1622073 RepID=A0A6M0RBR9_9CLOT|nr:transposase [Clostridium niameyense]NEZ47237.1 transposase [Clostridium niameyense]